MFKRVLVLLFIVVVSLTAQAQDATPESEGLGQIAFIGSALDMNESALYMVNSDGTVGIIFAEESISPNNTSLYYGRLAWSPDGSQLAYLRENQLAILTVDEQGAVTDSVTVADLQTPVASIYWSPAFGDKPAGALLAFTALIPGQSGPSDALRRQLLVYDVINQTTEVIYETQPGAQALNFTGWTLDGRLTIADFNTEALGMDVFTIGLDGERETLISAAEDQFSAVWSPDGTRVLYANGMFSTQFPAPARLILRDLTTGPEAELDTSTRDTQLYPSWSSDGTWAVYTAISLDGQTKTLLVFVNLDSGLGWPLDGVGGMVSWSPDSRYAFFVGHDVTSQSSTLNRLDLATGQTETIIEEGQFQIGQFAWRP